MSDESDFLPEFKERKTVHITIRPAGVAEQDSGDLMSSKLSLLNEIARLRVENEALKVQVKANYELFCERDDVIGRLRAENEVLREALEELLYARTDKAERMADKALRGEGE
jgi:hypothetical protein